MTRCLEVKWVTDGSFAILGLPEDWDLIRGAAKGVQRVGALDHWGEWRALYRVEPIAGRPRHYFVSGDSHGCRSTSSPEHA